MEGDTELYQQLHKLSGVKSEEDLEQILVTLWTTRKTGLTAANKFHVQSLLNLPSLGELDLVLACLRSLIRKCVNENFTGDDILKLFPPDLSLDLQSILIMIFQKYQNQWKQDLPREQHLSQRTNFSHQVNAGLPPAFTCIPSEITASLWPRKDEQASNLNHKNIRANTPMFAETNVSCLAPTLLQHVGGPENLGTLPRLKSMSWTLENRNKLPNNKVAVVCLKLQDYSKSTLGETTEVKFQLTRDTLEAMLRSMVYINEQLSSYVGSSPGTLQKKPRH